MPLNDDLDLDKIPHIARAGLRDARVTILYSGQVLFRFASTARPEMWAAGPWWIHEHDYHKVVTAHEESRKHHKDQGLTLGFLGRSATAVKQSWSKMDVVVKAVVNHDIKAFTGRGRTQYHEDAPNGFRISWKGWPSVEQLFIPNIGDKTGRTLLGYQALCVMRQKVIRSQALF